MRRLRSVAARIAAKRRPVLDGAGATAFLAGTTYGAYTVSWWLAAIVFGLLVMLGVHSSEHRL